MLHVVRFLKLGAAQALTASLLGSVALFGCSLKTASKAANLSLVLPNPSGHGLVARGPHMNGIAAASWNGFSCYAVNVVGPGIADSSQNPKPPMTDFSALIAGTKSCAYRGVVSNTFTFPDSGADVAIDVQVPAGGGRIIQLVGISNSSGCNNNFLQTISATTPEIYEIGSQVADLFGDASVTIPITYTAANSSAKRVDCVNGSPVTVNPVVTITSPANGSIINAMNVGSAGASGTCSEVGQPVQLLANGTAFPTPYPTCSATHDWSVAASLLQVNLPGVPAITLIANHANTAGVSAPSATTSFTNDTMAPVLASVSVSNSSPTSSSTFGLTYGAVTGGSYSQYCILENNAAIAFCAWQTGTLPSSFTVSASDGAKVLSIWLQDSAGNKSGIVSTASVVLDRTLPTLSGLTLTSATFTYNTPATLSWTANDANFGATPIALSYSPDNGLNWTPIATVANSGSYPFTLPTIGGTSDFLVKAVATDSAGNVSIPVMSSAVQIFGTPTQIKFAAISLLTPPQFGCTSYIVQTIDGLGGITNASAAMTVAPSLPGGTFYSDAACSTVASNVSISQGVSSAQVFLMPGTYGSLTMTMTSTPALTPIPLSLTIPQRLFWKSDTTGPAAAGIANSRYDHTMVSTGTSAIIWGGADQQLSGAVQYTGSVFNYSTQTWAEMTNSLAPTARSGHSAVWTGTKMIVWGGKETSTMTNTGAMYDPSLDSWVTTFQTGAPTARMYHAAVWTGSVMLVFGGCDTSICYNDLYSFDPTGNMGAGVWATLSPLGTPPSARQSMSYAWVPGIGTTSLGRLLIWGGGNLNHTAPVSGGAIYDVGSNSWITMNPANAPTDAFSAGSVVFGSGAGARWFIFGGLAASNTAVTNVKLFDPVANTWSTTPPGGSAPSARGAASVVSDGTRIYVWGGKAVGLLADGAVLDLAANRWIAPMNAGPPTARDTPTAVWDPTHNEMLLWGGFGVFGADALHRFSY